jgi:hypothetical protein
MFKLTEDDTKIYDALLNDIAKTIAHPHTEITRHDLQRAFVVINKITENMLMIQYLYSKFIKSELDVLKTIP